MSEHDVQDWCGSMCDGNFLCFVARISSEVRAADRAGHRPRLSLPTKVGSLGLRSARRVHNAVHSPFDWKLHECGLCRLSLSLDSHVCSPTTKIDAREKVSGTALNVQCKGFLVPQSMGHNFFILRVCVLRLRKDST